MTDKISRPKRNLLQNFFLSLLKPLAVVALLLLFIKNSQAVRDDVNNTILFLVKKLIPTLFPFAVITQALVNQNLKIPLSRYISKILGISENLLAPLCLGLICGFPIGAMLVRDIYKHGLTEKADAEKAIILSSQPSFAFMLMLQSLSGLDFLKNKILPISIFIVFCILIFTKKKIDNTVISGVISRQNTSLTRYIISSGEAMMNLSFFVVAFSALASVIKATFKNPFLTSIVLPFFELTTSINYTANTQIPMQLKQFLIPFSIGFGGLCVFMQIKNILSDTDLEIKKYIPLKLFEGIIIGVIICLLSNK